MPQSLTMDEHWQELLQRFFVPFTITEEFARLDHRLASLCSDYTDVASAFRHNLETVFSSVSLPFTLASASVSKASLNRFFTAERIRTLKPGPDSDGSGPDSAEERNRVASLRAEEKFNQYASSDEGRTESAIGIRTFLLDAVQHDALKGAEKLLVEQSIVMLWTVFEVLFRDSLERVLNLHPARFALIAADPAAKRRFETRHFSLDILVANKFDLSRRVGTILIDEYDLSDLPTIKATYAAMFPAGDKLRERLNDSNLWLLFQRRHLFVHRAGVVDKKYLDSTGDKAVVGKRLSVSPDDFERCFRSVLAVGEALFDCLADDSSFISGSGILS